MLYRVKLTSIVVDAPSRQQAYSAAVSRLRANPESFVAGVFNDETTTGKTPLWKRFVTGK